MKHQKMNKLCVPKNCNNCKVGEHGLFVQRKQDYDD